ncbi:MAG: YeeE/YedE thiosulfate transporter family protein [Bacillota bacterium]
MEKRPWLCWGILLGLLNTFAIMTFAPIGVSTTYPRLVGALMDFLQPGAALTDPYLQIIGIKIGWETMLFCGLFIGGLLGYFLDKAPKYGLPSVWAKRFGPKDYLRMTHAFIGGFLIVFGARLAGGCTSGHIISGMAQMAASGWVFAIGVFAAGMITAFLLHGRSEA